MFLMNSNVLFLENYFVRITRNDDLLQKAVFIRKKRFSSSQRKERKNNVYL